jgi:hypothetical protein
MAKFLLNYITELYPYIRSEEISRV